MRTKLILMALAIVMLELLLTACRAGGGEVSELKQIQQQRAGNYTVTLLNDTGPLKPGTNKFVLEFRKTSDNRLADVGRVQVNASMPMSGMPDMVAPSSATPSQAAGRYEVTSDFSMSGTWNLTVTFDNDQRAHFALRVQ